MSAPGGRLPAEGPGAPPRANGELVFAEPWESRAFGIAVSLCEQGLFDWEEFRRALIGEIAAWERAHPAASFGTAPSGPGGAGYRYYERWLAALERLLAEKGLCARAELDGRVEAFAARPAGHDHRDNRQGGG